MLLAGDAPALLKAALESAAFAEMGAAHSDARLRGNDSAFSMPVALRLAHLLHMRAIDGIGPLCFDGLAQFGDAFGRLWLTHALLTQRFAGFRRHLVPFQPLRNPRFVLLTERLTTKGSTHFGFDVWLRAGSFALLHHFRRLFHSFWPRHSTSHPTRRPSPLYFYTRKGWYMSGKGSCMAFNDLDGSVVRFYRVLRDPVAFERFRVLCELTPYAREEYEECRDTWGDVDDAGDPACRAWAWFVGVRQAFGGATGSAARHGWKYSVGVPGSAVPGTWGYSATNADGTRVASSAQRYLSAVERLPEVHQRLQGVQIERGDWRRVLAAYGYAGVLVYADPPYVWETRRGDKRYAHEMTTEDHHELTAALLASPALVVLSGYRHDAVHRPLEEAGWERTDIDMPISAARYREGLRRIESIWRNPAAMEAWERARAQPSLFEGLDR